MKNRIVIKSSFLSKIVSSFLRKGKKEATAEKPQEKNSVEVPFKDSLYTVIVGALITKDLFGKKVTKPLTIDDYSHAYAADERIRTLSDFAVDAISQLCRTWLEHEKNAFIKEKMRKVQWTTVYKESDIPQYKCSVAFVLLDEVIKIPKMGQVVNIEGKWVFHDRNAHLYYKPEQVLRYFILP